MTSISEVQQTSSTKNKVLPRTELISKPNINTMVQEQQEQPNAAPEPTAAGGSNWCLKQSF